MKWKIFKSATEFVIVRAESFDEALKKARMLDPHFCGGYVIEKQFNYTDERR